MDIVRVKATDAALELINEIKSDYPQILFHQSGGCCDGSSPMCYPVSYTQLDVYKRQSCWKLHRFETG